MYWWPPRKCVSFFGLVFSSQTKFRYQNLLQVTSKACILLLTSFLNLTMPEMLF